MHYVSPARGEVFPEDFDRSSVDLPVALAAGGYGIVVGVATAVLTFHNPVNV